MDNYIGRLLDNRYEILEVIGIGGMAVVYKARCHRLNRLVAIKILKDELSQDAEFRRRFHAESQAVAMLSHTNIVNVYDVSHSDNVDYIVMELIDGITMKQYMEQKGSLNWREALHFSTQIAKALEHAHSRGIIHRDIKPHNIMLLKDGSVKVADFGIARVSSAQSTLTREALGSVHYISPEQAKGSKIDYRSDLYSLGVVMYEMLTGRPPYDGETPVSVAIQHINAQAVSPRTLNSQIPLGLEQITMHAMTADMEDRYESATELLCDLDEFRRNPSVTFDFSDMQPGAHVTERQHAPRTAAERAVRGKAASPQPRPPAGKNKSTNSAALIAGIICIALALLCIGYFLYSFFFAELLSTTKDVKVPNFQNQIADEIEDSDHPDLILRIDGWEANDTVERGRVIRQTPSEGRVVKAGTTVSLIVSSGPSTDKMRDLVNYTEQNARTVLDNLALNLNVVVEEEHNDLMNEGTVIRTIPAADEQLTEGQTVTLIISLGPEIHLVPVPQLEGRVVRLVTDELDGLNLKYSISYIDSEEEEGIVVSQSIIQGEMVREGTTIKIEVSNGPADPEENHNEQTGDVEDPLFPNMPQTRIIQLQVPNLPDTMVFSIKMDGVLIDEFSVEYETVTNDQMPYVMEGMGIHQIDVYIDGVLWYTMTYNFDTGEVVE